MVTVRIWGGLGNQLFEYAYARCLSLKKNTGLLLDYYDQTLRTDCDGENLTRITDVFDLPAKLYIGKKRKDLVNRYKLAYGDWLVRRIYLKTRRVINEDDFDHYKEDIENGKNIYLIGHWQSEKYFQDIKDIIRKEFKFKIEGQASRLDIYQEIAGSHSVSLHIRGKDYLVNPIYGKCDVKYYLDAIDVIGNAKPDSNLKFFIFTDDIDCIRRDYRELLGFSKLVNVQTDFKSDALDLLLMSQCKHNVICNSSFSWWGAWLNNNPDKMVVAPRKWYIHPDYSSQHLVPEAWHKI